PLPHLGGGDHGDDRREPGEDRRRHDREKARVGVEAHAFAAFSGTGSAGGGSVGCGIWFTKAPGRIFHRLIAKMRCPRAMKLPPTLRHTQNEAARRSPSTKGRPSIQEAPCSLPPIESETTMTRRPTSESQK